MLEFSRILFLARKDFCSSTEYDVTEAEMMSGTFPTKIAQPFAIWNWTVLENVTELMRVERSYGKVIEIRYLNNKNDLACLEKNVFDSSKPPRKNLLWLLNVRIYKIYNLKSYQGICFLNIIHQVHRLKVFFIGFIFNMY